MYLNQTSLWTKVSVIPNKFGDTIYNETSTAIRVRRQEHVEEVRLKDGTVHYTKFIYYTNADVKEDDKLDGNLVVNRYDMITLGGSNRLRRLMTL